MPRIEMTGRRFGRLVVLAPAYWHRAQRSRYWQCQCDCGAQSVVCGKRLRKGETKSCGCLRVDIGKTKTLTHGMARRGRQARVYRIWNSMLARCAYQSQDSYLYYGGRGIRVCARWMDFANFYADMGDPPPGYSLDRINVGGHYEPDNCRWVSPSVQRTNQRPGKRPGFVFTSARQANLEKAREALRLKRVKYALNEKI